MTREQILILKHGALGDIVLATAGFAAIRDAFPDAHITVLTGRPYAELLAASPYFDEIWVDPKRPPFDLKGVRDIVRTLNSKRWSWVFDLQMSLRSATYQWLFVPPWPRINNASRWSSHGYVDHNRRRHHALRRLQLQLQVAGIDAGEPDISWLSADISGLLPEGPLPNPLPQTGEGTRHSAGLPLPFAGEGGERETSHPYALLVPGGAPHRPQKRWPAQQYAALAHELATAGITPVLLGTHSEQAVLDEIALREPRSIHLGGKTSIAQIAELARGARFAVGNDTGPMHVIAATGCPSTVIFSHDSHPALSAPVGNVRILRKARLQELSVDEVLAATVASGPARAGA